DALPIYRDLGDPTRARVRRRGSLISSTGTLLVISGGREAVPVIEEARRMGLRVLVSDGAPDAPGFRLADAGLLASTGDPEGTVDAVRAYAARTPVDGVLAVA